MHTRTTIMDINHEGEGGEGADGEPGHNGAQNEADIDDGSSDADMNYEDSSEVWHKIDNGILKRYCPRARAED